MLERYLADLHAELAGRQRHGDQIGQLNSFLHAVRQHHWDDTLPANALVFTQDYPARVERAPRALAEQVMAQIEHPDNLARFTNPAYRLVTLVLIRAGLRVTDALSVSRDCVVLDADGAPYLRYLNHKMKREALVPIDEQLHALIVEQQGRVGDAPVLFPRPTKNPDGRASTASSTYRLALYRWLARCDVRDAHGRPVRLTPHQWRHTLGTRLINRDVPQEVVRRILDHDSPQMTAHYARLHDTTVRRHWEAARKVDITGEVVAIDPAGPLAEAAWAKQRLGRATQALPNGFCGLPVQKTCPHANACLTCPMFLTTAEFLPQHRTHRGQVIELITAAQARGQTRLAEMNQQVLGNLDRIIDTLDHDADDDASVGDRGLRCGLTTSITSPRRHGAARRPPAAARSRRCAAWTPAGCPSPSTPSPARRGVSRSWIYSQPDLRAEAARLRDRPRPATGRAVPDRQRASDASLLRRVEVATQRIRELETDNKRLRVALAEALGEQRVAPAGRPHRDTPRPRASSPIRTS